MGSVLHHYLASWEVSFTSMETCFASVEALFASYLSLKLPWNGLNITVFDLFCTYFTCFEGHFNIIRDIFTYFFCFLLNFFLFFVNSFLEFIFIYLDKICVCFLDWIGNSARLCSIGGLFFCVLLVILCENPSYCEMYKISRQENQPLACILAFCLYFYQSMRAWRPF